MTQMDDFIGCEDDWSKNNFYDVIRLKIIESRYFPKETVKVGSEKANKMADDWKQRNYGEFQVRK